MRRLQRKMREGGRRWRRWRRARGKHQDDPCPRDGAEWVGAVLTLLAGIRDEEGLVELVGPPPDNGLTSSLKKIPFFFPSSRCSSFFGFTFSAIFQRSRQKIAGPPPGVAICAPTLHDFHHLRRPFPDCSLAPTPQIVVGRQNI